MTKVLRHCWAAAPAPPAALPVQARGRRAVLSRLGAALALLVALPAFAGVSVNVSGNQAFATISLPLLAGSVDADVTITFDTPVNLSADALNLTAEVVDPNDAALIARLPACAPACAAVDPAFPLLVTVEPPNVPWLFHADFDGDQTDSGLLGFLNSYEIEIHTPDLDCSAAASGDPCPTTAYRLFKAPVGGDFVDYTEDILKGSVRARGRDGAFSQFLIVADTRASLDVEQDKALRLESRIDTPAIDDTLRSTLLGELAQAQVAALVDADYGTAIADVDALIATVQANAGGAIANAWSADHSLVNDAGEIEGLAQTLRYTLVRLQGGN